MLTLVLLIHTHTLVDLHFNSYIEKNNMYQPTVVQLHLVCWQGTIWVLSAIKNLRVVLGYIDLFILPTYIGGKAQQTFK